MPPDQETNNQQPHGRAPFPRRVRPSIDGFMVTPRRPAAAGQPMQRPSAARQSSFADVLRPTPPAPPAVAHVPPGAPALPAAMSPAVVQPAGAPTPAPVLAPAHIPQPVPAPLPSAPPQETQPQPAPETPARTFTPPSQPKPKRWRLLLKLCLIIVPLLAVGAGAAYWFHLQSIRNNPATAFKDALSSSLATTQLQANASTMNGAGEQTDFDFTKLKDPLVSSQSTVNLYGASFQIEGYGSAQNTYISYAKFPPIIAKSVTSVAQAAWVQLRANSVEPSTVTTTLSNLADPRYQAFGPLLFGNFPLAERTRLVNFILAQHIYAYQPAKVTRTTLNGKKVIVYPVALNVNYLKIVIQSAAATEGFSPADVQTAVTALDSLKGSNATFYVDASTHRFTRAIFGQGLQQVTTDYSAYNTATLLAEPETNLTWQTFAPVQLQIELQAATRDSVLQLDAARQADVNQIHGYLAAYYTAHGYYPTYAEMDDLSWVTANLPGIDPDALRDPLSSNSGLSTAPTVKSYAYQPLNPSGKACINDLSAVSQLCSSYTLTAILSSEPYAVTNP